MRILRCVRAVSFTALLVAAGARAADFRGDLAAGIGVGHDIAGLQLELGADHLSGFASLGLLGFSSFALGTRWSQRPDGSGLGVALQTLVWRTTGNFSPYTNGRETVTIVSATVHRRWRWRSLLIDLGAGPAVSFDSERLPSYADTGNPADDNRLTRTTCFGIYTDVGKCGFPLDLELGVGFAF